MSQQIRLYYTASKNEAEQFYTLIESAFDEEGYPLALTEIDEKNTIYELSLYVDQENQEHVSKRFAQILSIDPHKINHEILPNIDWVQKSLEGLQPVHAGPFFLHGSHNRNDIPQGVFPIEIDANQAFGTGHHGTTAGCLEMIAKIMQHENPQNALDLGTGSGVLAIGMAKLKPIAILASDIDPIAIKVAKHNITLNGVEKYIKAITAIGFSHDEIASRAPFDLIIANILANPLIELAPEMVQFLQKDGSLVLSGILEEQHDFVLGAYVKQGLKHLETSYHQGWVTIHLK
ncbi:50S ribosomal protein L11 methyltransferase [Bartonella krasnovii]|uniref:Ribosomal protein L11 methyltransferase n=1 Tax=Bartonella krasnovii TaxID=2267275 RepID=A0A5B9D2E4_9HYPH|nr:50S ribosomal protein L11 methyltransferase [Bartonella krasnovii]QEE12459.1 50S ribosomal protein L11 methyltransferase [Bartonella krasnovii]UNF28554.1 50S ribosomal protein L11 methyltransferase [Bartonella krasnovii]UNF34932.1 50S ribosomal protein L11 methyltransferase [Bartonella krasnovii]UNF36569.1 50S ribosomal protein L11 methyltransferase [Bartonella krasnovii]UNF38202.1 50S ribosomal protein L11 methyltransferase [Bartonella krasnovii]